MRLHFVFFLLIYFSILTQAQLYIPQGDEVYHLEKRIEIKSGKGRANNFHSSIRPYTYECVLALLDSSQQATSVDLKEITSFKKRAFLYTDSGQRRKPALKYFYKEEGGFYSVSTPVFKLSVNPVFYFAGAMETGINAGKKFSNALYINSRGAELQGIIDNKISFYVMATDNQMRVPLQTKLFGENYYALPGEAYYKTFKTNGVDFLHAEGYVSAPITKHISAQFGSSKQFIGDGIRSLILSDFSRPHLFLKLNTKVWKINYQNLFYELTDSAYSTSSALYQKKFGATHHLSINAGKNFTIGLFESVIFNRNNNSYELNYLNPIIFYRSVEHNLGSPDNVLLGLDYKWDIKNSIQIYGQIVFDEFVLSFMRTQFFKSKNNPEWGWWANKYAIQIGINAIDLFRIQNLDLQVEYNHIRPYTYSYYTPSLSYTDFNQSMAHPLGANLKEIVAVIRYKPASNLTIRLNMFTTRTGIDSSGISYGADLLKSNHDKFQTFGNFTGQGLKTMIVYYELSISYRLFEQLFIDFGITYRRKETSLQTWNNQNQYLMLGLRLNAIKKDFMY